MSLRLSGKAKELFDRFPLIRVSHGVCVPSIHPRIGQEGHQGILQASTAQGLTPDN